MKNFGFRLLLFVVYSALAAGVTWPLALKMSSATYGYPGDNFGALHYFWWWKYTKLRRLPVRDSFLEEAPFGVTIDREPGTVFYYLPVKLLTLLTNEVFAYNLVLLLSFPLAGLAMYFFVFSATQNRWASFISGLSFSFSPYHFWKAYNHLDLALIWPLPLYVAALVRAESDSSAKKALTAGFLLAVTVLTNFYYGYFMLLFTAVYVLARFFWAWWAEKGLFFTGRILASYFLLFASAAAIVLPFTYHVLVDAGNAESAQSFLRRDSYHRPLLNLVSLSARPWDYFIPSQDHPVFGRYIPRLYGWIKARSNDFKTISAPPHERTVYLGWVLIVLALSALYLAFKSAGFRERFGQTTVVLAVVAAALFLVSLPPYVFIRGRTFYFPSFFLYKIFPMFRTYARLGVVVLLCVSWLAGVSLAWIFGKIKNKRKLFVLRLAFLALVLFEFLNIPPFKVIDFSQTPPEYEWLAQQPGYFSILEWPKSFNLAEALLFQRLHRKGVANWHSQSSYYDFWRLLPDLFDLRTAEKIAALGVRYVVVHKELVFGQPNPVDDLWRTRAVGHPERYASAPPAMEMAVNFGKTVIFEVSRRSPAKMVTIVRRGASNRSYEIRVLGGRNWSWEKDENRLYLINLVEKNNPKNLRVEVSFDVEENLRPFLEVSFDGEVIANPWRPLELRLTPLENSLRFKAKEKRFFEVTDIRVRVVEENPV